MTALAALVGTSIAQQAGAGAERYEVTITPPKRPGTSTEAVPEAAAPAAAPAAGTASTNGATPPAGEAAPANDATSPGSAPAAAVPNPVAKPSGPPRTLQVAAFRQHERAEALRSELAESFPDVAILEVQSGGEPLYRVNVGRLPKGPDLEALKKRLAVAGHPSFDVPAPAKAND